jgi:hypothetical protein
MWRKVRVSIFWLTPSTISKRDQTMVRGGYAMGVAAQILEHKLRATERWFQIDDPVLSVQGSQPGGKDLRLSAECEFSLEAELAVTESLLETVHKLSAKDLRNTSRGRKYFSGAGIQWL